MYQKNKKMEIEAASGVVIRVAGKDFPLTVSELLCLINNPPTKDPDGKKLAMWEHLAGHPAASVRCAVIESGELGDAVLEALLNDKATSVRLAARKALTGERMAWDDGDGVTDEDPCAQMTYAGVTAPVFSDELEALVWDLPKDDQLLCDGKLQQALMQSPAWDSDAVRTTVLYTEGLTDTMVQEVWLSGSDEDRLALLENPATRSRVTVSEAELTELVIRLEDAFMFVFWNNGVDAAVQKRIAKAIKGKLTYELSEDDARCLEAVLAGKKWEDVAEIEADDVWAPEDASGLESLPVTAGGKPIVFHWLGRSMTLDNLGGFWLFEVFPRNLAGKSRTLFDALMESSDESLSETARMRLAYHKEKGITPAVFEVPEGAESSAWVEAAGERFDFDPAAVSAVTLQVHLGDDEAARFVRELFEVNPAVRTYRAVREIAAEDEDMTRSAALILKDDTDDGIIGKLCENPAFWNALTAEEILAFAGDDPARQYGCIMQTKDADKRKTLCQALLKTAEDPEIRETAQRFAFCGI